ncbi:MAG: hypothetical protein ACLU4J_14530 [Butyricimonas paravirosa]
MLDTGDNELAQEYVEYGATDLYPISVLFGNR